MEEKYREIHALGATCCTDAYICNMDGNIYMMSLFGRLGIVKAICATIITKLPVTLFIDGEKHVFKRSDMNYRIITCNFEGLCHKIIMVDALFAGKDGPNIIAENDMDRIFSFVDSRVTTPLKPEWADWLIDQSVVSGDQLISFGESDKTGKPYRLFYSPDSEATDEMVLKGLQEGNLK